jgi:dihydroneopterin aldolase
MADRIELRGLRMVGSHGASPEERQRAQPFEVDVTIDADLHTARQSDDLNDTIDYSVIIDAVAGEVAGRHAELLEHLADRIAASVLARAGERAHSVTVTVRKLRPPVPFDLAWAAVTVTRP